MPYHNLNTLTVFPEKLAHNFHALTQRVSGIQVAPVVKSNAYGHGIKILAPLLAHYPAPFICVDSLYEAYELEKNGYNKDILIMGYVDPRDIPRRKNFIYAASSLDYMQALIRQYRRVRIHLFFDTGMHREGIQFVENTYSEEILRKEASRIEGIMSHFSTPEDSSISQKQIHLFGHCEAYLSSLGISPRFVHIAASGGLLAGYTVGNLARTGLAYYGYGHPDLAPSLRLTTKMVQIKHIRPGDCVGYDGTFCAEKPMRIGVLPIGYHDGLDRRLSGAWVVMIGEKLAPIIGRISMNLTTVDISDTDAREGDEVCLVDENPLSPVSLTRQAERGNIIPYDMLVHINKEMFRSIF